MLLAMSIQYANAQTITLNIGENGPDEYGLEIHTYTYDSYHTLMQYNGEYLTSVQL